MYSDFRERNDMTAEERREIFAKEILTADDIVRLYACSRHTAYEIIRNIKLRYNRLGDKFPGKVHIQDYLDCYGLDRNSPRYNGGGLNDVKANIPEEDTKRRYFYPSVMDTRYR